MELKGRELLHIKYGKGVIEAADSEHIWIRYGKVVRQFALNDVFAKTISGDALLIEYIRDIAKKNSSASKEHIQQVAEQLKRKTDTVDKNESSAFNLIVNCVYCDGGKTQDCPGFNGICSDEVLAENVNATDNRWCTNKECRCGIYEENKSKATRQELERLMEDGGYVCPESRLLRDWVINAGTYNNRAPRHIDTAEGKLCVLTTLENGSEEKDRYIFAMFIIESISNDVNGVEQIWADSRFRCTFPEETARKLRLWDFTGEEYDFSADSFALADDEVCGEILKRAAEITDNSVVRAIAEYFR